MKRLPQELGLKQEMYVLFCDNQSVIRLSKNPTFHSRSKHIDVGYHWICNVLEEKLLQLEKIHIDDNGSDVMTKTLPKEKHDLCRSKASLVEPLA